MAELRALHIIVNTFEGMMAEGWAQHLSSLMVFMLWHNQLRGSLPERGLQSMTKVAQLSMYFNYFEGMLPEGGALGLVSVRLFRVNTNAFKGMLPEHGLASMTGLTEFWISTNGFEGLLPEAGLHAMSKVELFWIHCNKLEGALPNGMLGMTRSRVFFIHTNGFDGMLPNQGLRGLTRLETLLGWSNSFEGLLPETGLQQMIALRELDLNSNCLEGMLPAAGMHRLRRLIQLAINGNQFKGMLPQEGLHRLSRLVNLQIQWNHFTGVLPEGGVIRMTRMESLFLSSNHFQGMLPEAGVRGMTDVYFFSIFANCYAGTLPEVFGSLTPNLYELHVSSNLFAGALPAVRSAILQKYIASDNYFQGVVPKLMCPNLVGFAVGNNLLAGVMPEEIVHPETVMIAMSGVIHQGTVPVAVSRISTRKTSLVLGHGLTGAWPQCLTTLSTLSLWANSLEGHLPELHIDTMPSDVLLHSNHFSCKLPNITEGKPGFSTALIGNHFAEPVGAFPPWITADERCTFFCVSQWQGIELLLKLICGALLFSLAFMSSRHRLKKDHGVQQSSWLAVNAWQQTVNLQTPFSLASCVLLALYSSIDIFACTNVFQRLRFPAIATRRQLQTTLAAMLLGWIGCTSKCFHSTRVVQLGSVPRPEEERSTQVLSQNLLVTGMMWNAWIILCLAGSAPAAIHSAVSAVPGALGLQGALHWVATASVSLLTAVSTSYVLPRLAKALCSVTTADLDALHLQVIARLLALPIVPCIVTLIFHADCLGAWTRVWRGCRGFMSREVTWSASQQTAGQVMRLIVLSKSEACGLNLLGGRLRCVDAMHDRLMQILLAKYAHQAFTIPAERMCTGRAMKWIEAVVLLLCVWLDAWMLGPLLPLLLLLTLLVSKVHTELFILGRLRLLSMEDHESRRAGLAEAGQGIATGCILLLHGAGLD